MGATLLLMGSGESTAGCVAAAGRAGMKVHLVDLPHRAAPLRDSVSAVHPVPADVEQYWIAAARAAAVRCGPDGVLGLAEQQVMSAAMVAETFGLPGPSLAAASTCRDAALLRTTLADAGVAQPPFLVSTDRTECEEWAALRYPVVVDSPHALGTSARLLATNLDDLTADLDCRMQLGEVLIEEQVEGPEYLWVAVVIDHKPVFGCPVAVTKNQAGTVDLGYDLPGRLDPDRAQRMSRAVDDAVRAVGVAHAVVQVTVRICGDQPRVLGVSLSASDPAVLELMSLAYRLDSYAVLTDVVCGGWPAALVAAAGTARPSAIRFLDQRPGVLDLVTGRAALAADPHVVRHAVTAQPGDDIPAVRHVTDRRAYTVFSAPDHDTLHATIDRALREFRLVVREPPAA